MVHGGLLVFFIVFAIFVFVLFFQLFTGKVAVYCMIPSQRQSVINIAKRAV